MNKAIFFLFLIPILSIGQTKDLEANSKLYTTYIDEPFAQEYHEAFIVAENSENANNVRAIQPDSEGGIWIATKNGIYHKEIDSSEWKLVIDGNNQGPAYDVEIDKNQDVWMATWNGVYRGRAGDIQKMEGPKPPIAQLLSTKEGVYAMGPYGIWLYQDKKWSKKDYNTARSIRTVMSDNNGGLWIGTDVGLYHCNDEKTTAYQGNEDLISAYVRGMDFDPVGNMWIGGLGGVSIRNQEAKIGEKRPKDGIPNANVNSVVKAPDGKMWVGTEYGITRFVPGEKDYSVRLGRRWLVSDEVRDIAFDQQGNAWIATANGVSAIKNRKMTLATKADYFYDKLIRRHVRDPWIIARSKLVVPGDTTTIQPDDDDNDGEFTSNYLAMESFRYATTNNPEAKERAKKAFDFLHFLREVTGEDGFFARSIIPVSWEQSHDMNRTYTERELAEAIIENPRQKPVEKRWHLSKDGKWKWKGDTSSDEISGHLFGYYCYYNLVADNKEKKRVADHFSKIMDHLIENDFNLVDVDGTHTKWGVWSPSILNHNPDWAPEKALNSLELLAFLKFTHHITKKEKYQKEYLKLIKEDGYLENAKTLHNTNPSWETYFDIFLSLYMYPTLINYEDDPVLKKEYHEHLEQWFKKHKKAKSPMINFTYNLLTGGNEELDNSIAFLKDAPLDLVDWYVDNAQREDLKVVRQPILEELQTALRPPSEYRTMRWDQNPYVAVSGDPTQEKEPVYWLLPYWMGRYLNLISAEK
ncbi:ligand-binding sensor domain-containing protein [Arenibacter echinorum]|uniref:Two component regulator with propeller domain n=1 Tax=Arenibacter echinorum TaxID=440515 RepID=A0A327R410_9FLAO|nr:two-component regulator propeller domain-containing protein [Arenibacter echinorum]RAJ11490.1 two component regulator with propeller domain [Arenibacter echinorum]